VLTKISLPDDVLDFWGLDRDPFTNEMETSEDIFDMKELAKAEKKIMVAVDKNGWVAITGAIGSGKSTLIKRAKARLEKKSGVILVEPRTFEKQYLRASHVCDSILQDINAPLARGTLEHRARAVGRALEAAFRENKKVVILIDEAHLLTNDALLALKRIYECELGFKKLLSIILVGQNKLARTLKGDYEVAEVGQRVDLLDLKGINGAMGDYLDHKLQRAGMRAGREVFDKTALKVMHERAHTPLEVNNLAAWAMIRAHEIDEKTVTGEVIKSI
jgi:type II secretory pathway predicted ATPase ExeA